MLDWLERLLTGRKLTHAQRMSRALRRLEEAEMLVHQEILAAIRRGEAIGREARDLDRLTAKAAAQTQRARVSGAQLKEMM